VSPFKFSLRHVATPRFSMFPPFGKGLPRLRAFLTVQLNKLSFFKRSVGAFLPSWPPHLPFWYLPTEFHFFFNVLALYTSFFPPFPFLLFFLLPSLTPHNFFGWSLVRPPPTPRLTFSLLAGLPPHFLILSLI